MLRVVLPGDTRLSTAARRLFSNLTGSNESPYAEKPSR